MLTAGCFLRTVFLVAVVFLAVGAYAERTRAETTAASTAEFQQKWDQADRADADALYALGQWCEGEGLDDEASRCYAAAVKADANHPPSRRALGHKQDRGVWVTEDQWRRAHGKAYFEGEWIRESRYLRIVSLDRVRVSPWDGAREGVTAESTHFVFHTDMSENYARGIVRQLELLVYHYHELFMMGEAQIPEADFDLSGARYVGIAEGRSYDFDLRDGHRVNLNLQGLRRVSCPDGSTVRTTATNVTMRTDPAGVRSIVVPLMTGDKRIVMQVWSSTERWQDRQFEMTGRRSVAQRPLSAGEPFMRLFLATGERDDTRQVAVIPQMNHLVALSLTKMYCPHAPGWLLDGIGEFFERGFVGSDSKFHTGRRDSQTSRSLAETVRRQGHVKFLALLRLERPERRRRNVGGHTTDARFNQSWSMVDFLSRTQLYPEHRPLPELMWETLMGTAPLDALESATGTYHQKVEEHWMNHVRRSR